MQEGFTENEHFYNVSFRLVKILIVPRSEQIGIRDFVAVFLQNRNKMLATEALPWASVRSVGNNVKNPFHLCEDFYRQFSHQLA